MATNTLGKYLLYGGISKEEYKKTKPMINRQNLKLWKYSSVFFEILFVAVFVVSLVLINVSAPDSQLSLEASGYIIPFGILSVYMMLFAIVMLVGIKPESKSLIPLVYISNIVMLSCVGYASIFSSGNDAGVSFCAVIAALPFFTVDRPLRYSLFTMTFGVAYVLLSALVKPILHPSVEVMKDVLFGSVFTLVSIFISLFSNITRIKQYFLTLTVEVERDTDALTGVKNINAYDRAVEEIKAKIRNHENFRFAIAIFDINDLKGMNDSYGHSAGDKLIIRSSKLICDAFKHSPVYRIGGDEFVVILSGEDYSNRERIIRTLHEALDKERISEKPEEATSIAFGVSIYNSLKDFDYVTIFSRADAEMYDNKRIIKSKTNH